MNPQLLKSAQMHFRRTDPTLYAVAECLGNIPIRSRRANFESFVRIIVNQQLSNSAAKTIFKRLKLLAKHKIITPSLINEIQIYELRSCGLSSSKSKYLKGIADFLLKHPRYIAGLKKMDEPEIVESLSSHKGFGEWSASIFRLFYLQEIDVFPTGDVSLEKAICRLYGLKSVKGSSLAKEIVSSWSPYRSIAAFYLWAWIDQN